MAHLVTGRQLDRLEIWLPNQHVAIRKIHVDGTTNTQLALDGFQVTWGYPPGQADQPTLSRPITGAPSRPWDAPERPWRR